MIQKVEIRVQRTRLGWEVWQKLSECAFYGARTTGKEERKAVVSDRSTAVAKASCLQDEWLQQVGAQKVAVLFSTR